MLAHQYRSPVKPVYDSQVEAAPGGGVTATLPGASNLTTFLTRLTLSCPQVSVVTSGLVTITGLATTLNYQFVETTSAGGFIGEIYDLPIPASAQNTAIVVHIPVISGGSTVAVNIFGFQSNGPVALN